jgi:type VI secretion system protein ImpC
MSTGTQTVESGGTAVAEASLLEQCYAATKQTDQGTTLSLLKNLTDQVEKKNVDWEVNLSRTIQNAIDKLDALISKQLAAVLHHPDFQQLEGSSTAAVNRRQRRKLLRTSILRPGSRTVRPDTSTLMHVTNPQSVKALRQRRPSDVLL